MKIKISDIYKWWIAFIIFIILTLAGIVQLQAQNIGFNGAGFFENQTAQSDEWLEELNPFVLRVPGGAIAKYANPSPERGGWGLDSTIVDSITTMYKSKDEEQTDDALEKWYRKTANQPEDSYLDRLIALQVRFPEMRVIYAANIYIEPELAIQPIEYLLLNGVNIVVVEMGNESYSQVKHDFEEYVSKMEGLRSLVRALGVPVSHPAAPSGTRSRKDHEQWNESLANYNAMRGDWITFHPYYDGREFPSLQGSIDTVGAFNEIASFDFAEQFLEMKAGFPSAGGYIVTESNSQPSRLIGDTDLNGYLIKRLLEVGGQEFDFFCIHNGVSPDVYGFIYGKENEQRKNKSFASFVEVNQPDTVCRYDTTFVEVIECDTATFIPERCIRCQKFFYALFHRKRCLNCIEPEVITCDTLYVQKLEFICE